VDLGVPVIFGDATLRSTLEAARVRDAAAVAIMTGNDMVNIETALAVRDLLGPGWGSGPTMPVVVRVFDRSLGRTVAERFGFRHVQSTEEMATVWFVGAARGLDVLGSFPVADRTFMVGRLRIDAGTGLVGLAMNELSRDARVVAIDRGGAGRLEHPPRRGTRFGPGDLAYVVGPHRNWSACCAVPGRGSPGTPPAALRP
jgi:Trk K+ transport system NAD-binding subunit